MRLDKEIKSVMVPVTSSKILVIESRKRESLDFIATQNEGVLVNAANPTTIRLAPALIVTDAQLKKFVSIFKKVMSDGK